MVEAKKRSTVGLCIFRSFIFYILTEQDRKSSGFGRNRKRGRVRERFCFGFTSQDCREALIGSVEVSCCGFR